jgi:uncharacterized protein
LINTIRAVPALPKEAETPEGEAKKANGRKRGRRLALGVGEGGWHAAEALIIARYLMFTQVYFHRTRVAYDHHLRNGLRELLPDGRFPPPDEQGLEAYLKWDDWRVLGMLADGQGGEHGRRLVERDHYRAVYYTPESPLPAELDELGRVRERLGDLLMAEERAEKSWYSVEKGEIPVVSDGPSGSAGWIKPLSECSSVVGKIAPSRQVLLFVRREDHEQARKVVEEVREGVQ